MTSAFCWQNSDSLCPASFCTPKAKLDCYSGYLLASCLCIPVPYVEKDISFWCCYFQKVLQVFIELFNFSFFWGSQAPRRAVCGTRGSLRTIHGGGSAPSCCAFSHVIVSQYLKNINNHFGYSVNTGMEGNRRKCSEISQKSINHREYWLRPQW